MGHWGPLVLCDATLQPTPSQSQAVNIDVLLSIPLQQDLVSGVQIPSPLKRPYAVAQSRSHCVLAAHEYLSGDQLRLHPFHDLPPVVHGRQTLGNKHN